MFNNGTLNIQRFEHNSQQVRIYNLADIHYGSCACDRELFRLIVDEIARDDDARWLTTGDIVDANLSKSKFYEHESMDINEELNDVISILKPIASKCIGWVSSNHHTRIKKISDVDIDSILTKALDVLYMGGIGVVCLSLGDVGNKQKLFIGMHHGDARSTTMGSKFNSMQRLTDCIGGCDVYLEGHSHTFYQTNTKMYEVYRDHNRVTQRDVLLVSAAHLLDWHDSYGSDNKYKPTPKGIPIISFDTKRNLTCILRGGK